MKLYTKYDRPEKIYEKNNGENLVETIGYMTNKQKIEQFMLAGVRLKEWRQEQFDFKYGDDIHFDLNDPTRLHNFDLADASSIMQDLQNKASTTVQTENTGNTPENIVEQSTEAPVQSESVSEATP